MRPKTGQSAERAPNGALTALSPRSLCDLNLVGARKERRESAECEPEEVKNMSRIFGTEVRSLGNGDDRSEKRRPLRKATTVLRKGDDRSERRRPFTRRKFASTSFGFNTKKQLQHRSVCCVSERVWKKANERHKISDMAGFKSGTSWFRVEDTTPRIKRESQRNDFATEGRDDDMRVYVLFDAAMMDEEVAIIGLWCRFPSAEGPDEFWRVLENGEDCMREIPAERWNQEAWYSPDRNTPGKSYVERAGFVDKLISKLEYYGIQGPTLKWLNAFLTNREQTVVVEGKASAPVKVASGSLKNCPGTIALPLVYK
ncbi:hypothetical protein Bbelb_037830 [Branchiostoma belcheri]|nr:hypothetical protein Bbelb_037830 [Branchiostoma belcheri]